MVIHGANFTNATAVQFGAVNGTISSIDPTGTVITAVSPAGTAGTYVHITVTTPLGTSPQIGADTFLYAVAATTGAPSVTALDTTQGPAAGGTTVMIHGANFTNATAVQFGAVNGTISSIDPTGTVITAVSPAGTAGTYVHITVTTPLGTSPQIGADTFLYAVAATTGAPSVTALETTQGPAAGGTTVVIHGANFTNATAVQFGAVNGTISSIDPTGTVITAVSPAGTAGTYVHITVTTPLGTSPQIGADTFLYAVAATTGAPSVTALETTQGPAAGGTTVVIHGANFTNATAVQFGAVNGTISSIDPTGTVITAVSPAGTAGTYVHITVTTPLGTSPQIGADTFLYA